MATTEPVSDRTEDHDIFDPSLEEWSARIPEFRLEDPDAVTWAGGQVRGPRHLPVVFP